MAVTAPPPLKPPRDGVIKEARRRHLRRVQTAAACLLTLAGLGIGAWALVGGDGVARRTGRPDPRSPARGTRAAGFGIRLSPSLDGGTYGWCVGVEERSGAIAGGGCSMIPEESRPLAFTLSEGGAASGTWSVVVLTTPRVAAVLVNGHQRVPTVALEGLPYGLRAARIVFPLRVKRSRTGRPTVTVPREPALAPLSTRGLRLPSRTSPAERFHLATHGPCALNAQGLPAVKQEWSHVARAITAFPGAIVGRAFLSCIDTEYSVQNWPVDAAILLDASHPGMAPAPIPGLTAVSGQLGYFNGPGDFKGELTAVQRGNAWVVAAGGRSLAQRIELLRHLKATIRP